MIGKMISHYRVTAKLGKGGMGEVYRAEDMHLGRSVAIKLLTVTASPAGSESVGATWEKLVREAAKERAVETPKPEQPSPAGDPRVRFLREARTVSALNDPGIVTIYDVGEWGDRMFLVMEFVEGETLRRLIDRNTLDTAKILRMAIVVTEALIRAHKAGVIHRDLKPENIILGNDGRIKLLDFGVAKLRRPLLSPGVADPSAAFGSETSLTMPGIVLGTYQYMSPEQTRLMELDQRSDLFSLGSVLYESVTRKKAFSGGPQDAMFAIVHHHPKPMRELAPDLLPDLEVIIQRLMQKDPEDRYPSGEELLEDLHRAEQRFAKLNNPGFKLNVSTSLPPPPPPPALSEPPATPEIKQVPSAKQLASLPPPIPIRPPEPAWKGPARLIGGLALGVLLTLIVLRFTRTPSAPPEPQTVLVTRFGLPIVEPALSVDGKMVVFSSDDHHIYVAPTSNGVTKQVAEGAYPHFSQDGARVLYTCGSDFCEVGIAGGDPRKVVTDAVRATLSADGSRLAFIRSNALYAADKEGGNPLKLADVSNAFPAWNPDGQQVFYTDGGQLLGLSVNGGSRPRVWVANGVNPQAPALASGWIYYSGPKDKLWRIPIAGGKAEQVSFSPDRDFAPMPVAGVWLYYVNVPSALGVMDIVKRKANP